MQRVNPWHLTESYSLSQLLGKAAHELRFWLYDKFPYLASLYCHLHMQGGTIGQSKNFDTTNLSPQGTENELGDLLEKTFIFAGERHKLTDEDFWWPKEASRLFVFHLHYLSWFHDLVHSDEGTEFAREHLDQWIDKNQIGKLEAWHPYVISRRLVNLLATWHILIKDQPQERVNKWLYSFYEQTTFLYHHQEDFLGGNHLLENYVALIAAGLFLDQRTIGRLFFQDTTILLEEELKVQILQDGGHCEGSYGYHVALIERLHFLCGALKAAGRALPHWLTEPLLQMEKWAATLTANLDEPPIFGDSWRLAPMVGPAQESSLERVTHLPESGLLRIQWNNANDVIFFRYGSFGGHHVPGHGHCDCTSYELFHSGHPFICDSGNLHYRNDNLREYFRSTRAHNVALVEGVEQSEFSHTFRAGKTARGELVKLTENEDGVSFEMQYEAATQKGKGLLFKRKVLVIPTRAIIISDEVHGLEDKEFSSYLHFVPDAARAEEEQGLQHIFSQGRTMYLSLLLGEGTRTEKGHYAPNFGQHHSTIVCRFTGRKKIVYALTIHKPTTEEKRLWSKAMVNLCGADRSE